jgi:hypothetical protein
VNDCMCCLLYLISFTFVVELNSVKGGAICAIVGFLCSIEWQFFSIILGQPVGPIVKVKCRFHETSVTNYHFTLHKIPEDRRLIYTVAEA